MRMKKPPVPLFLILTAFAAFSGCLGGPAPADTAGPVSVPAEGLSLEEGLTRIAREIEAALPEGRRVAVVNFESPSARFSDFVLEELQGILVNGRKLVVTERSQLEPLRNELSFQMSGELSEESALNIGHWLGAQLIVTGGLVDLGGAYRCRFNGIDIETAVRQVSAAATLRRDTLIAAMLPAEGATPALSRQDAALTEQYFNAGFAHYEAKRYKEAVENFTRALELKRNDEASLRYRGLAYYDLKDYDRVIADYTRLIQIEPGNAMHYLARADAYRDKGYPDEAIRDCNEALRINPAYAAAYNCRANAYADKGEHDRAIEDYSQALRINPAYAAAYYNRGIVYRNKGEYDQAIENYSQAIRINPNYAAAYNNRGIAYEEKGDYGLARADWEQVLRIDPNHVRARLNLGTLRERGY
jgi:tetratricopeptide (TPR) repeat protein